MMHEAITTILRPGISGFGGALDSRWQLAGFRTACHAALRPVRGGRLVTSEGPGTARNHYRALVELARASGPDRLWILLNAIHPLLAFARGGDGLRYQFLDEPALAAAFHGPCEPVPAAVLAAPLDLRAVAPSLAADELDQANYWRPQRVGDLVFNHWD